MLSLKTGATLHGDELQLSVLSGGQNELAQEVVFPTAAGVQDGIG